MKKLVVPPVEDSLLSIDRCGLSRANAASILLDKDCRVVGPNFTTQ
jgi:hypothetical protein